MRRPVTPLDLLTGSRFSLTDQWRARITICQHVRGLGEIGPRYRLGSNARRSSLFEDAWNGTPSACHHCGGDGAELMTWHHYEYCPACHAEWPVGDYDWWKLGDVLRHDADRAAGLVEPVPTSLLIHGFDVATQAGRAAFFVECDRRRAEREGANHCVDWDAHERQMLAHVRAVLTAQEAGARGVPLSVSATNDEQRAWSRAASRSYAAALALADTGRAS